MATVTAEIFVHAPVKQAYRAFTNATSLREWLCDVATADPHPRGEIGETGARLLRACAGRIGKMLRGCH